MPRASLYTIIAFMFACTCSLAGDAEPEKGEEAPKMTSRQRVLLESVKPLLEVIDTNEGIEKFVTLPTGGGNAAQHYAKLEILYPKEQLKGSFHVAPDGQGVKEILEAAKIKDCSLSPHFYPQMEAGTSKQPDLVVFQAYLSAILDHAEALAKAGQTKSADEVYNSAMVWGWHFTKDRSNLVTLMIGLSIERKTSEPYAKFLRRNLLFKKAKAADEFCKRTKDIDRTVAAKAQVFLGDFRNFNCLYSAIEVAKNDKDPLWRQEAAMRLGVMRHGAPDGMRKVLVKNKPLQDMATAALVEMSQKDKAPWIRKLAAWSVQHITPERFAEMRRQQLIESLKEKSESGDQGEDKEEAKKE
ncbi:MAG: hypothetical protein JXR97_10710 [Planctomycetes bacterium]|nr:hypothetical protein [Planctomycetota bacterium]